MLIYTGTWETNWRNSHTDHATGWKQPAAANADFHAEGISISASAGVSSQVTSCNVSKYGKVSGSPRLCYRAPRNGTSQTILATHFFRGKFGVIFQLLNRYD